MSREPLLERPRVLRALRDGSGIRLCVLQAPAGYGKTTALEQLAADVGDRASMLTLTQRHRDPATLEHDLERIWESHVRAAERAAPASDAEELYILLDDSDELAGAVAATTILRRFIEQLPMGTRVVLASRRRPELPLGQLRGRRLLREVDAEELAFTASEFEALLTGLWETSLTPKELEQVIHLAAGWVTGAILLIAQHSNGSNSLASDRIGIADASWAVFEYFSEIVADGMTEGELEFATLCSILEELRPAICARITNDTSALSLIQALTERSLFTVRGPQVGGGARFHGLFRRFLQDRLCRTKPAHEVHALHAIAAAALREVDEPTSALVHLLEAQLPEEAANLLAHIGVGQLEASSLGAVEALLERLPGSVMRSAPWLLVLHGRLQRLRNDFDGAIATLNLAEAEFNSRHEDEGLAWVASEKNQVRYRDEVYDGSAAAITETLENPAISALTHANLAAHLCWMQCETGPLSDAILAGENALSRGAAVDDAFLRGRALMRANRNLALASVYSGNLDRALALMDRPYDGRTMDPFEIAWTNVIYAVSLVLRGSFDEALALCRALSESTAPYDSAQRRWAAWWAGNIHRATAQRDVALNQYQQAGSVAGIDFALSLDPQQRPTPIEHRVVAPGVPAPTQSVLQRAGTLLVEGTAAATDDPAGALSTLTTAAGMLHASGHRLHEMSLASYRARTLLRMGQEREGNELQDRVIGFMLHNRLAILPWGIIGHEQGTLRFADAAPTAQDAVPLALEECSDPEIRSRLQAAHSAQVLTGEVLTDLRRHGLTWREIDVFALYYLRASGSLGAGSSIRDRAAKTLCISEHTLKSHITRIRAKLNISEARDGARRWTTNAPVSQPQ